MPQNLVRLKTCAEERPISIKSLRRYIAAGKIRGYRFGPKLILVDLNEVDLVLLKEIPTTGGSDAA
jgi:predicted site-specific integrase-resolvase